jgi:hypothetical protein
MPFKTDPFSLPRGEVNVTERRRSAVHRPAGGLLWRAAGDRAQRVTGGTLPHRCCMIARDLSSEGRAFTFVSRAARASSGRDRRRRGLGGARNVTAEDSLGDLGRVLRRRNACQGLRRRWPRCRPISTAAMLRSILPSTLRRDRSLGR